MPARFLDITPSPDLSPAGYKKIGQRILRAVNDMDATVMFGLTELR